MIHSLLQAMPCPALPQAGPSACWPQAPVLSRVFSLKPCPAKCETLPTLPSSPEGFQRLLVGGYSGKASSVPQLVLGWL